MSNSLRASILARTLELETGAEPAYEPINVDYLASMQVASATEAIGALKTLEATAWATAEACMVGDISRLLLGDATFIEECAAVLVTEDPSHLRSKSQLLSFIARIVRASVQADVGDYQGPLPVRTN